jgi:uncharacterized membrane protein
MFVVFPLGLLATSLAFDIAYFSSNDVSFGIVSFWMIAAGVVGAIVAAIFGLVDYLGIQSGTRAKAIGTWHGIGNAVVTVLFIISWFMRLSEPANLPSAGAFTLSVIGVLLALITAWLGGELVDRLGVGVDEGANLNAPSSLSGRPARG